MIEPWLAEHSTAQREFAACTKPEIQSAILRAYISEEEEGTRWRRVFPPNAVLLEAVDAAAVLLSSFPVPAGEAGSESPIIAQSPFHSLKWFGSNGIAAVEFFMSSLTRAHPNSPLAFPLDT